MLCEFPLILSNLRKTRGLSQRQASEQLGVSQALLSHYERGIRECSLDFLLKLADFYGVTCDYLLGKRNGEDPTVPQKIKIQAAAVNQVLMITQGLTNAENYETVSDLACVILYKYIRNVSRSCGEYGIHFEINEREFSYLANAFEGALTAKMLSDCRQSRKAKNIPHDKLMAMQCVCDLAEAAIKSRMK